MLSPQKIILGGGEMKQKQLFPLIRGHVSQMLNDYVQKQELALPLGSTASHGVHKGFGLLLVTDILTGLLSGDGGSMFRRKGEESDAFCALRIDAFPTGGGFAQLMDEMIGKIHAAPTIEGADRMK